MVTTRTNKDTTATPPRASPHGDRKDSAINLSLSDDTYDTDGESAYVDDPADSEDGEDTEPFDPERKRKRTATTRKNPAAGSSPAVTKGKKAMKEDKTASSSSVSAHIPTPKRARKDWTKNEDLILLELLEAYVRNTYERKTKEEKQEEKQEKEQEMHFAQWAEAQGRLPGRSVRNIRDRVPAVFKNARAQMEKTSKK
ncbi:uncharacterized protein LOC62_03G004357 [Vanrija pseudolonga]|uniref:Myb-like domain-containing protein n=1 Tax=Vanrija pseudolonga TaxID=143232 RepID=A0AAF0YBF5_9TREE|nr:hypothetical protein LOC62_03G004357 [Vanrija pseudolonga]